MGGSIILVEAHYKMRQALSAEPGLSPVTIASASTPVEALACLENHDANVVIIDLDDLGDPGELLLRHLKVLHPLVARIGVCCPSRRLAPGVTESTDRLLPAPVEFPRLARLIRGLLGLYEPESDPDLTQSLS